MTKHDPPAAAAKPPAKPPAKPFDPHSPHSYVERSHQIMAVEREKYLKRRRQANQLQPPADDNLTGLCISGGGVRSATLGLGMLQAFLAKGILKHFDYLSTVSGGGYIGACLSSLLSREPNNAEKYSQATNPNRRYKAEETGVDEANCPLSLKYDYEYKPLQDTKLTPKHQLLHLRRYGEYLTPRKSLLGWDVSRAVGALFSGIFIHGVLFLLLLAAIVLLHHVLFAGMSHGHFMNDLQHPQGLYNAEHPADTVAANYFKPEVAWAQKNKLEQFNDWYRCQLQPQFYLIIRAVWHQWRLVLAFLGLGGLLGWWFIRVSRRIPKRVANMEQDEARYANPVRDKLYERPGGEDLLWFASQPFIKWFTFVTYVLGPVLAYGITIGLVGLNLIQGQDYFVMLALPVSFALGLFLSANLCISLYFINNAPEQVSGRLYRSFYTGMQGATFMGLLLAFLFPIITVLLFGKHGLVVGLLVSFVPVAVAYYFTMQSLGGKSGSSWLSSLLQQVQMPLLNLSIFLFSGLALAWVSNLLFELENWFNPDDQNRLLTAVLLLLGAVILVLFLGHAANSNDISLHYFYRDRLSEAYLRTDGRVERPEQPQTAGNQGPEKPPRPKELFDATLRNHENLRLSELGDDNFRGPYPIIVAALNLQGSQDLAKKTLKSDHFIFSKYFIGSRTTGYFRSDYYRGGGTKLSTAMAISAAAVASGMGLMSFAASNFYMTLLNLRTGYWIENPWYLYKANEEKKVRKTHRKGRRDAIAASIRLFRRVGWRKPGYAWRNLKRRRFPFWLRYLLRELSGSLSANSRLVYVSDGGHTGDNNGLLPLVQRRCKTIVIADFEEDGKYSFGSFSQGIRLAKAIYNADIKINLMPLLPKPTDDGLPISPTSVVEGTIHYPAMHGQPEMEGKIVYLKSSVSLLHASSGAHRRGAQPDQTETAPVFMLNYYKSNPTFPHQSTADQYFDEIQFEAYRMLGEHIGRQAADRLPEFQS